MGSAEDEQQESESEFKVTDRRQFTSEGEIRSSVLEETEPPQRASETEPREDPPPPADTPQEPVSEGHPEAINLSSFLISLATTGMVHLGEIPEPTTGQKMENLEGASQMIEILSILKEKTEGNLSTDESRLLEGLLYELRMKFLSKTKAINL